MDRFAERRAPLKPPRLWACSYAPTYVESHSSGPNTHNACRLCRSARGAAIRTLARHFNSERRRARRSRQLGAALLRLAVRRSHSSALRFG